MKIRKIITYFLLVIICLVGGGFLLNWYMTYRLQNYLRTQLSKEVARLSNDFYDVSFEKLSIGLFDGELKIENIKFQPDSLVLDRLQKADSLPSQFYAFSINSIDFKGLNLTWRKDYKQLNFTSFQLLKPEVKLYQAFDVEANKKQQTNVKPKTLYEMVAPLFNVISVAKMNMEHASISYVVMGKDKHTSTYALNDVHFDAYNFVLDSNSHTNGKLLYCDNFEFKAETPQTLLHNNQFSLTTQAIKLSTTDSLIQFKGIRLEPNPLVVSDSLNIPSYMAARIDALEVKGISLKRLEAKNYLEAKKFDLFAAEVSLHQTKIPNDELPHEPSDRKPKIDTLINSWSLYSILSPIFSSVSIDTVVMEKGKFKYAQTANGFRNVYTLDQLDFQASNFLVDSLSDARNRYWHATTFKLDAKNVRAYLPRNNYDISIGHTSVSTAESYFRLSNIKLRPLTTAHKSGYVLGKIASINLDNLTITDGITAQTLNVNDADISYVISPDINLKKEQTVSRKKRGYKDSINLDIPFLNYLAIGKVSLNRANLVFENKKENEKYTLNGLNAYLDDFLMNKSTLTSVKYLFEYSNYGFHFKNFDNDVAKNKYRLQVAGVSFSSADGNLILDGLKLSPNKESSDEGSDSFLYLNIPHTKVEGLHYSDQNKALNMSSLYLGSPNVFFEKNPTPNSGENKNAEAKKKTALLTSFAISNLAIDKANVAVSDKEAKGEYAAKFDKFVIENIAWQDDKGIDATLLAVSDLALNIAQPDLKLDLITPKIEVKSPIYRKDRISSSFDLHSFVVTKPKVDIWRNLRVKDKKAQSGNIYESLLPLINKFSIYEFGINDVALNYVAEKEGKVVAQHNVANSNFHLSGLAVDAAKRKFELSDISFNTGPFTFPLKDSFNTIKVGAVALKGKGKELEINDLEYIPRYPKLEYAYKHPKNADFTAVSVGRIVLTDIDLKTLIDSSVLHASHLMIDNTLLENIKNKNLSTPPKWVPMIYEKLQKAPLRYVIDSADVSNLTISYEELARKGKRPGQILFTNMNAKMYGLTNVPLDPHQFIELDVDGYFMGTGHFTAQWLVPVDSTYDRFLLTAHLTNFNLQDLNGILMPITPIEVKSGRVEELKLEIDGSSRGALVQLYLNYNNAEVTVYKHLDGDTPQKMYSRLANLFIRNNNPNKMGDKPRIPLNYVERDPYHSTFNYIWQIVQPPLVESVGVSNKKQQVANDIGKKLSKIKSFFSRKKKVPANESETKP